ncbi:hypothetical protein M9Y10_000105 [Tritrichomonas musculus]|uniref:F5/8 type C domain-containing protein n=1 Tax=Tritrichomonas musculus TaxID=1915356 RepID=A0ABR2L4C6_9EUKA
MSQIELKTSSILTVPLQTYNEDFTFIVNGTEFKTKRLIADLLSPKICQIHSNDPIIYTFAINTSQSGDFSRILNLSNFNKQSIPESELPFIIEVIEHLGNETIQLQETTAYPTITVDNIFDEILKHEKYSNFYRQRFSTEINFISSHFFELCETKKEDLLKLHIDTIISVLTSNELKLTSEDQLLQFINELYLSDSNYSILYETVLFSNVTSQSMKKFIEIFDYNDMSNSMWKQISDRLEREIEKMEEDKHEERYSISVKKEKPKSGTVFNYPGNNEFCGIINHLRNQSNNNIESVMNITASSINGSYIPSNVTLHNDRSKYFDSNGQAGDWICFDFKNHSVIPTDYTIMSISWSKGSDHPRSWVIECCSDNSSWEVVDEVSNTDFLNGSNLVHTFKIQKQPTKGFRYVRMRSTGPDCSVSSNYLSFDSFELYGTLL